MDEPIVHTQTVIYQDLIREPVVLADIHDGKSLQDIATGTARIPRMLVESILRSGLMIGLDIIFAMLAQGKASIGERGTYQDIRLVCGSALYLPLQSGSLDGLLCGLGTHHIQVPKLVAEMRRVLKPGGRLVLADVCASRFWRSPLGNCIVRYLAQKYQPVVFFSKTCLTDHILVL